MSNILKKIGELLGFKWPERSAMTEMEPMAEVKQMEGMQQELPSNNMAAMPGEMGQMAERKQRERQSNDMTAMNNKMAKMAKMEQQENQSDGMESSSDKMGKMTEMKQQKR
jgi:hypothetical protein